VLGPDLWIVLNLRGRCRPYLCQTIARCSVAMICPLAARLLRIGRQGQISLTSKIRTLDHVLEQAKLAAFVERTGVRQPIELRSFQPHVAPALNQSPMLASVFHPFDRSKLGKT